MRRVVVVGGGAAGMLAALRLGEDPSLDVTLLTKGPLGDGSTAWAQGGVAAAMSEGDSPALHAADTVAAGAGLVDGEVAERLTASAPGRVADLVALGLVLDGDGDGDGPSLGLEAAHSAARILHAGGDATGAAIARVLAAAVHGSGIRIVEECVALDAVLAGDRPADVRGDWGGLAGEGGDVDGGRDVDGERDGDGPRTVRVVGLRVADADGERVLDADAVVLATGGAGQLYSHTTNPAGATADGVAIAARAGAVLADLEFLQFHPTALAVPGSPLVSEAVRGAGALLLDADGRRFLTDVHPRAELAPRDVVARAVAERMAAQGGAPVLLDARGIPGLAARFPTIDAVVRAHGFDWTCEPVPVTPAAHYWMGGVAADADGRTSVPGLWAVGEVSRTGLHGANRLASNSLVEALATAEACAAAIRLADERAAAFDAARVELEADGMRGLPPSREELQRLMWADAGLARDEAGLRHAAAVLAGWRQGGAEAWPAGMRPQAEVDADRPAAPVCTTSEADATAPEWPAARLAAEDANLLVAASLLVDAALARTESRGAHARTDRPSTDPAQARSRFVRVARPAVPHLLDGREPALSTTGGPAWL